MSNEVSQVGTVAEVNAYGGYLTLNTDAGLYTVILSITTPVLRQDNIATNSDALAPGQQVQVLGVPTAANQLQASLIRILGGTQPPAPPPPTSGVQATHHGPLLGIRMDQKSFVMLSTATSGQLAVAYGGAALVLDNGAPAGEGNLQPGAWLVCEGLFDGGAQLVGQRVSVRQTAPHLLKGELVTVDGNVVESWPGQGAMSVQGDDGRRYAVAFGGYSNIVVDRGDKIDAGALTPGTRVQLRCEVDPPSGALVARSVKLFR
jgi:hypothetical protein